MDPNEEPLPADHPIAVDDYGTTAEEWSAGEPLDIRLRREIPDPQPIFELGVVDSDEEVIDTGEETTGTEEEAADRDELDLETPEHGLGVGADLDTRFQPDEEVEVRYQAQPEGPIGDVTPEGVRRAGRLVDPSEGVRQDTEPDMVAEEVGPDFGGYTAEEIAMRVEPE